MSENLATITVVGGAPQTFRAANYNVRAFVIGNESGLTCTITLNGAGTQKTLYPSVVDWFQVNDGFTGEIVISPVTVLNNVASFPASSIIIDAIAPDDPEEASNYPISLVRNTNVGNQVTTVGGVANSVQNDNNAVGTSVVEATVTGDGASAVSLTNSGHLSLGTVNNNGLFHFVGAAGNVDIASTGVMSVDNKINFNLAVAETGNDFVISVATGHKIALQVNGSDIVDVNGSGLSLIAGTLSLLAGSLARVKFGNVSATNAGVSVTHGLGTTPDIVLLTVNNLSSAVTATVSNVGATTFTVTSSANTGVYWCALKS